MADVNKEAVKRLIRRAFGELTEEGSIPASVTLPEESDIFVPRCKRRYGCYSYRIANQVTRECPEVLSAGDLCAILAVRINRIIASVAKTTNSDPGTNPDGDDSTKTQRPLVVNGGDTVQSSTRKSVEKDRLNSVFDNEDDEFQRPVLTRGNDTEQIVSLPLVTNSDSPRQNVAYDVATMRCESRRKGFLNFFLPCDKTHAQTAPPHPIETTERLTFNTIGVVRSCFRSKYGTPRQGRLAPSARGVIELFTTLQPESLAGLSDFSHLWIIFVFHMSALDRHKAKIRPPVLSGPKRGTLATRSPHRPSPLGLSVVKIERVEGRRIYISGLDIVDRTPVLDVKPYHHLDSVACGERHLEGKSASAFAVQDDEERSIAHMNANLSSSGIINPEWVTAPQESRHASPSNCRLKLEVYFSSYCVVDFLKLLLYLSDEEGFGCLSSTKVEESFAGPINESQQRWSVDAIIAFLSGSYVPAQLVGPLGGVPPFLFFESPQLFLAAVKESLELDPRPSCHTKGNKSGPPETYYYDLDSFEVEYTVRSGRTALVEHLRYLPTLVNRRSQETM